MPKPGSLTAPELSVRIVTVDYYLCAPINGLDVTVSEFRGCEIRQVPVVRVFGSTPKGKKICLHVHGVFPYLYIPCETANPEPKLLYEIANSIDKAINVSFKQTNSNTQHVYKVKLVKGIPFYGYHRKNHQFFKIFLYNPSFVKKTADLLQSGAIMGRSYQPHEVHLNFIMQFFIDFNLYGMSFVDLECVKFRKRSLVSDDIINSSIEDEPQELSIDYVSSCELEADCFAKHVLNKRDFSDKSSLVNPGIEALWADERRRRKDLEMSSEIMQTPSQTREDISVTESHNNHRKRLVVKLAVNSEITDQNESDTTLLEVNNTETQNTSNMSLNKSIYPAETPDEKDFLDATFVDFHHPFQQNDNQEEKTISLDYTINEDIVALCSQNTIQLSEDDVALLGMLKDLEGNIDEDSILSTQINDNLDPEESIDDDENNYTLKIDSEDEIEEKSSGNVVSCSGTSNKSSLWHDSYWEDVENISQLDGTWDESPKVGNKKRKLRIGLSKPLRRSKRKMHDLIDLTTPVDDDLKKEKIVEKETNSPSRLSQNNKEKAKTELGNLSVKFQLFGQSPDKKIKLSPKRTPKKSPQKINYNFNPLQIIIDKSVTPEIDQSSKDDVPVIVQNCKTVQKNIEVTSRKSLLDSLNKTCAENKSQSMNFDNKNEISLEKCSDDDIICIENSESESVESTSMENGKFISENVDKNKNTKITASQYDRLNNYFPEAGTSHRNSGIKVSQENSNSQRLSIYGGNTSENDSSIISFYNTSVYHDSSLFNATMASDKSPDREYCSVDDIPKSSSESSFEMIFNESPDDTLTEIHKSTLNKSDDKKIVLIPKRPPPSRDFVVSTLDRYDIPHCHNSVPHYSNYNDTGGQIEAGNVTLKLKSDHMHFYKTFTSSIPKIKTLNEWREKLFLQSNISQVDVHSTDLNMILSTNRSCILIPVLSPPRRDSVNVWLENSKKTKLPNDEQDDKVPFGKCEIILPNSPNGNCSDSDYERLSLSPDLSLSLTNSQNANSETDTHIKDRSIKGLSQNSKSESNSFYVNLTSPASSESGSIECGQRLKSESPDLNVDPDKTIIAPNESLNLASGKENPVNDLTINESHRYKFSGDNYQDALSNHDHEFLTIFSLEVHALSREELSPDPSIDPICAVYYSIINDCPENYDLPQNEKGIIVVEDDLVTKLSILYPQINCDNYNIIRVKIESDIFDVVKKLILKWDPDILCGFEIELGSWGYLFQRACLFNINFSDEVSRIDQPSKSKFRKYDNDDLEREIKIIGRITLDVWRLLRHEVALTSYSFENIVYHIMHERVPAFSHHTLTSWWNHPSKLMRGQCMEYYLIRVNGNIRVLLQLDLIGRTSELAKLFGIQWYEVLSRGSQFRVESMMIRLARPHNFVLVSPSVQQRAAMKAPECLPLILEPESRFYGDPVIVLDFQSLYPSMMIAYNYCYSTCIGKVKNMGKDMPFEFGASQLRIAPSLLNKLNQQDMINWSPCGVGFVKPAIRKGILPAMLSDILNTRFMVKKAMKRHKKNKTLQKILHNRQLGLKLIANVTYGYTSANFSGRMPCVEVGDSVVSKGRETLERAIKTIEMTPKWRARVVYGDTDSLFILVSGRSRDEAFDIGMEIAETITNENPNPVKLKFEKVYQPCILQTKKRYVGYMYESKNQSVPEYDAKGIETVRRDGCPAAAKILEKSLKILFDTYDVSKVKSYVCRKFQNILEDKCSIQDFIFAKEFRGMKAYRPTACIPALEIAKKQKQMDHRREPREGERVPYVIVNGAPGQILLNLARSPRDLLTDTNLRLNHNYYITKAIIPPLNRCFMLIGADVYQWFANMPRRQLQSYPTIQEFDKSDIKKGTLSQYFAKMNCIGCEIPTVEGLCSNCASKPNKTMLTLQSKINDWQRKLLLSEKICRSCCGRGVQTNCSSLDCPVLFYKNSAKRNCDQIPYLRLMEKKLIDF